MVGLTTNGALDVLLQRLNWPVPMVRWQAARQIRNLLQGPCTHGSMSERLLAMLAASETESEVCALLTVVFLSEAGSRPSQTVLANHIHHPSVLSDMLLEQAFGSEATMGLWGHSGEAPDSFDAGSYFEEHKTAHVPPIFYDNLRKLQRETGLPFVTQWRFEWRTLCDRIKTTRYTRYPHYFDVMSDQRYGIVGQYLQRQAEVYRSAYLRTLALAVEEWGMPISHARWYGVDAAPAIGGMFDIEPSERPQWLRDIPEQCANPTADVDAIVEEFVAKLVDQPMVPVSMQVPLSESTARYGDFALSAYFVTSDYEIEAGGVPYEPNDPVFLIDRFDLNVDRPAWSIDELKRKGSSGYRVPVCTSVIPRPHGHWHNDYMSLGVPIASPACVPMGAQIRCSPAGIEVQHEGATLGTTKFWHDEWTPRYAAGGGTTRCGVAATVRSSTLTKAASHLGLGLGWFAQVRVWERDGDYSTYSLRETQCFVIKR